MTLNGQYTHCFSVRHSADTIWIIASSCGLLVIARLNSCYLRIEVGRIVLNRGYRFLVQLDTVCQILQLKMSDDSFTLTPSFWNRHSIKYTHCITLECDKIWGYMLCGLSHPTWVWCGVDTVSLVHFSESCTQAGLSAGHTVSQCDEKIDSVEWAEPDRKVNGPRRSIHARN